MLGGPPLHRNPALRVRAVSLTLRLGFSASPGKGSSRGIFHPRSPKNGAATPKRVVSPPRPRAAGRRDRLPAQAARLAEGESAIKC
jgi:hypothetical protein